MRLLSLIAMGVLFVNPPSWSQPAGVYCEAEREFVSTWLESARAFSSLMPIEDDQLEAWRAAVEAGSDRPQMAEANRRLGFNYYGRQLGDWAQAISHLESALSIEPTNPKVLEDLGRALVVFGRSGEGLSMLDQVDTKNAKRFLGAFERASRRCE